MTQKELLQLVGQELFPDWKKISGLGGGLIYRKKALEGVDDIIIFPSGTLRDGLYVGTSLVGARSFDVVENILESFFRKKNLNDLLITIKYILDVKNDWSSVSIESAEDLTPIYAPMREVVFDQILPFLERFNTLEAVYEHAMEMHRIRDTDEFALSRFIHSPVEYRLLILKRLIVAPDFIEYGERFAEAYKDNPHWDSKGFYIELFEYLKKM
ncbi:MAG: hypothetical protein J0L99_16105 [Chitinophagales bacterium]|nr:hypothetical protein [Chitinophagales bacterium]